ncbi:MAG TPA: bifunctional glutamate N-acetyltransferase/amino-acid acetyltransferase ArgJ [Myxococcaceae bacterium]|nr:bifunctional glutamate N-acetyltransferase/amino-acid acetyltransferase ArgJ [Myxococcaceae bacterium]
MPKGFRFAGVHSGVKAFRKDLALILSDVPATAAGCFTRNLARAAPILELESRLPCEGVRALLVNAGNANALTGEAGREDVRTLHAALAGVLGIGTEAVVSASTGIIGHRLPVEKLANALPLLQEALGGSPDAAAEAIMTTDTRRKIVSTTLRLDGHEVTVGILGKGSGMVHPALATVLGLVVTDAAISPDLLAAALREVMADTFNLLTVDGEMSTNDAVIALANGCSGAPRIASGGAALTAFTEALRDLFTRLSRDIASDGEGATKRLEVEVIGAPSTQDARELARAVAGSTLVKTAIFGADPNWGRVLATVGARAGMQGIAIDPHRSRVSLQGIAVYDGRPTDVDLTELKARMRAPEILIELDLRAGEGRARSFGCDLTYDYVKINADYSAVLVASADGKVARDDRLANYSPGFKTNLLVGALQYISRFSGQLCVVKYGGAAMIKPSLKESFCRDIELLRRVGLRPIVVHGGGEEMRRAVEKLGGVTKVVEGGLHLPGLEDARAMETILTGSVNTELVSLINREEHHAVGVSGKDGGLLRARRRPGSEGHVGDLVSVNVAFLKMLLDQGYVPVISPVGIGEDGHGYPLSGDAVAARIAVALGANKLVYLTDVVGILQDERLVSELTASELTTMLEGEGLRGGMRAKALTVLEALEGGVTKAHIIDGRVPHSLIAELFTDKGVGTLITRAART